MPTVIEQSGVTVTGEAVYRK